VGAELLREIEQVVGSRQEARWILEESRGDVRAAFDLASRRARGEPLQHVLGHWGFRTLDVRCDGRALVPRPETEVVAGLALSELAARHRAGRKSLVAVDLGTGSGVIACSIAAEVEPGVDLRVIATDRSSEALSLARENAALLPTQAGRSLELLLGDWFDAVPARFRGMIDVVVCNPPYLAQSELAGLDRVVAEFDPVAALVSGPRGLEAIEHVLSVAPSWLDDDGCAVVEMAPHQAEEVCAVAKAAGYGQWNVVADLAGRDRVIVARL
jgi:release factor glutamine methyltransferase